MNTLKIQIITIFLNLSQFEHIRDQNHKNRI